MGENKDYYSEYVDYYYGDKDMQGVDFNALTSIVVKQLEKFGISKTTATYLQRRKWDRTNDYMLDNSDAMQAYSKRKNPSSKHMCAVLLEGKY